jgi:hypothetical protein
MGFSPHDARLCCRGEVITVVGVESVISVVPIYRQDAPFMPQFVHALAVAMRAVGTNRFYSNGSPVVIVDPGQARLLSREGYDRAALRTALFEQSQIPLADFPFGNFPTAEWIEVDGKILICEKPSDIIVLVAGDGGGLHSTYMQPVCLSAACSAPLER